MSGVCRRNADLRQKDSAAYCAVARLRGCAVARLRGCAVARLRGCAVAPGITLDIANSVMPLSYLLKRTTQTVSRIFNAKLNLFPRIARRKVFS
jgi:hypothetical protein